MSFLSDMFKGGAEGVIEGVAKAVDRFVTTDAEKQQFLLEAEKVVTERMKLLEASAQETVSARMQVIVAELQHGDEYTKRTRPMIARWGLYVIIWNCAVAPTLGGLFEAVDLGTIDLPTGFWAAWGGIVGTYAVGRSFEKLGADNIVTRAMTGRPKVSSIVDKVLSE